MAATVLHIATSPNGGAGIAARRLHNALRSAGLNSRFGVAKEASPKDGIEQIGEAPVNSDVRTRLGKLRLRAERRATAKAISPKLVYFSDDRVPGSDRLVARPGADVLNLHWVANFVDYGKFFPTVIEGQPLVWTLHDMAPMTGGCHHAMDCDRFTRNCGACPLLGSTTDGDLTRRIHRRKAKALSGLRSETTRIVAPSRWLAEEAQRSSLLGGFQVDVIPNGLDVSVFRPRDKALSREALGLPQDARIVLFSAASAGGYHKGFDLLEEALLGVTGERTVTLAALGGAVSERLEGAVALGRIDNPHILSHVYSAADVFVLPTRAEAFGQVLAEAMACGVPCVSFDIGGVPDVVRHEETGLLAPAEDVSGLREAIDRLLRDDALRQRMGARGRVLAEAEFSDLQVAALYKALYEELVTASRSIG